MYFYDYVVCLSCYVWEAANCLSELLELIKLNRFDQMSDSFAIPAFSSDSKQVIIT